MLSWLTEECLWLRMRLRFASLVWKARMSRSTNGSARSTAEWRPSSTVNERTDRVEQKLDATFRWVIGIVLVNWITLMLAIFLHR